MSLSNRGLTTVDSSPLKKIRPGLEKLDYRVLLKELNQLDHDMPLILEHLPTPECYQSAVDYIRSIGKELNIPL